MSDTLQEREDQMDQHQSGTCTIPECPCHEWSSQIAAAEDSRRRRESAEHQPAVRGGGDDNEHSPLPWRTGGPYSEFVVSNVGNEPSVARATGLTRKEAEANARFIVECVNQHQSLVAERERLLEALRGVGMRLHGIQAQASSGAENAYDIASDLRGLRDEILRILNEQRSTSA